MTYIERDFKEAYIRMKERALGAEHDRDVLLDALEDALCELSACATQLNCRSGGSVVRAIEAARQALAVVGSPKP
jgi:hypothetical protein